MKKNHDLQHGSRTNIFTRSAGRTKKRRIRSSKQRFIQQPSLSHESFIKKGYFIVDSGASIHMMSKNDLALEVHSTIRKSNESCAITTANGPITTTAEGTVYARDLDHVHHRPLFEDSTAGHSQGQYVKKLESSEDSDTKWIHRLLPRVIVETSPRSDAEASGDREQYLPDWLSTITEGLVEERNTMTPIEKHANAQKSQELHAEGILKGEKAGYRKVHIVEDTITADHTVFNEENESRLHYRHAEVESTHKQDCTRYNEVCSDSNLQRASL